MVGTKRITLIMGYQQKLTKLNIVLYIMTIPNLEIF